MARPTKRRRAQASRQRRPRRRWPRFFTHARVKRWWKAFRRAPGSLRVSLAACALIALWVSANFTYQVVRKPSELFFPVAGALHKTPAETWRSYGPLFEKHSTDVITPELLAALAQAEGSGNPLARTYWRWSLTAQPFEIYRPASSAVGMYQMTDGTFEEARRYCVHDHRVVADGPWHAWRSCWFNWLYTRTIPSHAIELTAAHLDLHVGRIVRRHGLDGATPEQKRKLAAVIHLCGPGAGSRYARQGFRFASRERCGDHAAAAYLAKVAALERVFAGQRTLSCKARNCASLSGTRALTTTSSM